MFSSFLKFAPGCAACGADFSSADAGDGPAFFVMFAVGFIVVPFAFILLFGVHAAEWAALLASGALAIALSLALLPLAKATLFALQWRHKAAEAHRDDAA